MASATTQVIAARVPNGDAHQLRAIAENQGVSLNRVLRQIIDGALSNVDKGHASRPKRKTSN